MQVRVTDVKRWVGREETLHFREAWPALVHERAEGPVRDPAEVTVVVRNTGGALVADLRGEAQMWVVCARCLTPFWLTVPFAAVEEFREEPGPYESDQDYYRYQGDHIDLDPIVADLVAVAAPLAPLCHPDCQGLCPVCGANRNETACGCERPADPRWEALTRWRPEPDPAEGARPARKTEHPRKD
ncbi:MAG: DUF177 domain-containing protein [Firmicutes bacterium]|nr:DUF177 domain-containing protein [Alicyclobacillaceae bacterium]MCL6496382.1 DUF177 domain-containing protein [Bacillota bacterium]